MVSLVELRVTPYKFVPECKLSVDVVNRFLHTHTLNHIVHTLKTTSFLLLLRLLIILATRAIRSLIKIKMRPPESRRIPQFNMPRKIVVTRVVIRCNYVAVAACHGAVYF
jgi:hypothetical protein